MYILKNAWLNITRNKGRNILIGIILVVVACACTVSLAIKNTSNGLIKSYNDAYEVEATIGLDRSNMMKDTDMSNSDSRSDMRKKFEEISNISVSDIKKYADSELVKNYYYTYSLSLNSNDIEKTSNENSNMGGPFRKETESSGDFTITGYSSLMSMNEFINGKYTVSEKNENALSKVFDGSNCFINKELADSNDIKLNDEITFVLPDDTDKTYTFKVVGIYEEKSDSDDNMSMFSNSSNTIITNTSVLQEIDEENDTLSGRVNPTFVLKSYDDSDDFEDELYEKGMSNYLTVSTNEEDVKSATSSINNVSSFAMVFLIITLIIGGVVLFVINQINIRERKYEIGVLRTIGMKKKTLTLQFLYELLIVSLISLLIGLSIGSVISKPVSNKLLENEISSSNENMNNTLNNFGEKGGRGEFGKGNIPGRVQVQAYDSINAVVDMKVICELLVIGLSLTLISSVSSTLSIQRFSPLEILKERS